MRYEVEQVVAAFAWADGGKTKEPGSSVNKNLRPTDNETHLTTMMLFIYNLFDDAVHIIQRTMIP
jgi:hypothetical protein